MATITQFREALITEWIAELEELDANNIFKSIDDAVPLFTNDLYDSFMVVMFAGAGSDGRKVFTEYRWNHNFICSYFLKLRPDQYDHELRMEDFIEQAKRFAYSNQRLGGIVQIAMPIAIDIPEIITVNDISFYAVGVTVQIWDKF